MLDENIHCWLSAKEPTRMWSWMGVHRYLRGSIFNFKPTRTPDQYHCFHWGHQMLKFPLLLLLDFLFLPAAMKNWITIKENVNQSHTHCTEISNQDTAYSLWKDEKTSLSMDFATPLLICLLCMNSLDCVWSLGYLKILLLLLILLYLGKVSIGEETIGSKGL